MRAPGHSSEHGDGSSNALRLLVASEIRFLRESVGDVLGRTDGLAVIGFSADRNETLGKAHGLRPDMVLMDAAMRGGSDIVRELRDTAAALRVVVFALSESVESVLAWAEAGVAGYIPATAAMADLQALVRDVGAGRQTCSAGVAAALLRRVATRASDPRDRAASAPALTPREREIVHLIGAGLSNKEIARRLNIGVATTKSHVHSALGKLNVQRRTQAANWLHGRSLTG
jgi:two-component system, NarL family, nitrate/nitrite response regulator NarL